MLTGRMGAALTRGLRRNVMACVKHFALNSMEDARFEVDVAVDEHALHEVYLPHFKAVVDAGADSVMSSYNSVNGEFADVNTVLLTDILRDEWGFDGVRHQRLGVRHPRRGRQPGSRAWTSRCRCACCGPVRCRRHCESGRLARKTVLRVGAAHSGHHPAALRRARRGRSTRAGGREALSTGYSHVMSPRAGQSC